MLRHRRLAALWTLGVLILAALPAGAQYPTPEAVGLNYSFSAGAALLVSQNMENQTAITVGVSWYDVAAEDLGTNAAIGITGDWVLIQRSDDKDVSLVPVMLNYKQYGQIGGWRAFVNFGLGVLAATDAIPEMQLGSGANFGWTGGLGVDISSKLYFQARFIGGTNPGDDGMASLQLGLRF